MVFWRCRYSIMFLYFVPQFNKSLFFYIKCYSIIPLGFRIHDWYSIWTRTIQIILPSDTKSTNPNVPIHYYYCTVIAITSDHIHTINHRALPIRAHWPFMMNDVMLEYFPHSTTGAFPINRFVPFVCSADCWCDHPDIFAIPWTSSESWCVIS